ncbi:hypothetical protein DJ69_08720 [Halorubrum persicum]|uniref:Uncharacterized protein n=1 Tax=Halorubrum persicum TaxID=1383844 RepID=A0A2G1WJ00_9EURY|nr:hypothetical protein DJ69_08720 [Halorubrum persicum]
MQIDTNDTVEISTDEEDVELQFARRYYVRGALNKPVLCFEGDEYELHWFPSSGQATAVTPEGDEKRVELSTDETERDVTRVELRGR